MKTCRHACLTAPVRINDRRVSAQKAEAHRILSRRRFTQQKPHASSFAQTFLEPISGVTRTRQGTRFRMSFLGVKVIEGASASSY